MGYAVYRKDKKLTLQIYWPRLKLCRDEFILDCNCVVRICVKYPAFGFQILGFGFGVIFYEPARKQVKPHSEGEKV